jgi:hypothetical protein
VIDGFMGLGLYSCGREVAIRQPFQFSLWTNKRTSRWLKVDVPLFVVVRDMELAGFGQGWGFGQGFDELVAEGGDVFGFAAGDEVTVLDDFLVDPVGAGVGEVGLDGGPGGDSFAFDYVGFDQTPWTVADGGYGFSGFDELLDEGDGVLVGAELVGVDLAAGEDKGVVVGRFDLVDEMVDLDGLAPVGLVPAFNLSGFDGDDVYGGSCLFEVLFGVSELDLLVAVGG